VAVPLDNSEKYGIAVEFAQSGMVWFTPDREARVKRELERLREQDAAVTV
jgi:hypothetical protein